MSSDAKLDLGASTGKSGKFHRSTWDYSMIMDVTISRPAKEVWPFFVGEKKNIWTQSEYTTIEGAVGAVGEIYTHAHKVHGFQVFYEAISVKPERHLVLKITVREDSEDERRLMGYDFITLNEVAGETVVGFQQATAFPVDKTREELPALTGQHDKRIFEFFQNLKRVVESGQ